MPKYSKQFVYAVPLNLASGIVRPDNACIQFVVNNPTAFVVKLGLVNVLTDSYEFIVKAQSMFVSPKINFPELKFVIDAFTPGVRLLPTIYCYNTWVGTPGSTNLT